MREPKTTGAETVHSITVSAEMPAPAESVFAAVSDTSRLPQWAQPVKAVRQDGGALVADYQLPDGVVTCRCEVRRDPAQGVVEWTVHVPSGGDIRVSSRVQALGGGRSQFTLTLHSPPMPKHLPKDARSALEKNLSKDLDRLRRLVAGSRPGRAAAPRRARSSP